MTLVSSVTLLYKGIIKLLVIFSCTPISLMDRIALMVAVHSPVMARPTKANERPKKPDDKVRFIAAMTRAERAEVSRYCDHFGKDQEEVGAQWILERLALEKKKLGW